MVLFSAGQLANALFEQTLEELTGSDFALYTTVWVIDEPTPTEVAGVLGVPLTTASDRLNRAVERGHMSRELNPRDGRSFLFRLTDGGLALVEREQPRFLDMARRINGRLDSPAEVRDALAALDRAIRAELEELDSKTAPAP